MMRRDRESAGAAVGNAAASLDPDLLAQPRFRVERLKLTSVSTWFRPTRVG